MPNLSRRRGKRRHAVEVARTPTHFRRQGTASILVLLSIVLLSATPKDRMRGGCLDASLIELQPSLDAFSSDSQRATLFVPIKCPIGNVLRLQLLVPQLQLVYPRLLKRCESTCGRSRPEPRFLFTVTSLKPSSLHVINVVHKQ